MSRLIYVTSPPVFDNKAARKDLRELSDLTRVEIMYTQEIIKDPKSLSKLKAILPSVIEKFNLVKSWYDTLERAAEENPRVLEVVFAEDPGPKRWKRFHSKSKSLLKDMQSRRERSGWHYFHCLRGQQHHNAACAVVEVSIQFFGDMRLFKDFQEGHVAASRSATATQRSSMIERHGTPAIVQPVERPPTPDPIPNGDSNRDSGVDISGSPDRFQDYDRDVPEHLRNHLIHKKEHRRVPSDVFWPERKKDSLRLCTLPFTDPMPWKWFHGLPTYVDWKTAKAGTFNLLPILALSGVGKTVLSSSIIHDLRSASESCDEGAGRSLVINFSFRHDMEYHKSALWMLRSCISQLIDMNVGAKLLSLGQSEGAVTKGNVRRPLAWPLEKLWERFVQMLRECCTKNIKVYWILDGLNDCDATSKFKFLALLRRVVCKYQPAERASEFNNIHVIITSTPDRDLLMELEDMSVKSVDLDAYREDEIRTEIDDYIRQKVGYLCARYKLEDTTREEIRQELCKRHDGHFLWAAILVGRFENCHLSKGRIREILNSMPKSLAHYYGSHLKHAELTTKRGREIKEILSILMVAQRQLSVSEVKYILALQDARPNMDEVEDHLFYTLEGAIEELCGGLVKVYHKDDEAWLRLVHGSVKKFLLSEDAERFGFRLDEGEAHHMLAMACLHFLTLPEAKDFAGPGTFWYTWDCNCFSKGGSCTRHPKHPPLHSYAATYWNVHLASIKHPTKQDTSYIKDLMDRLPLCLYEVDRHRTDPEGSLGYPNSCRRRPEETAMIHTAAHFNILWLVKHLVEEDSNLVHKRVDRGGTPLVFAAERGNLEVIEVLIKANANVNAEEYDHWTPLHWAKTNGHEELAGKLIGWGAREDIRDDCNNWTPEEWASECWRRQVGKVKGRAACRSLPQINDNSMQKRKERYETAEASPRTSGS